MEIILASKSPRRREILSLMGITDFSVSPAPDEEQVTGLPPDETVKRIAEGKAKAVARLHESALVIAADTLVFLDGEMLGKPKDESDAKRMLRALSGRSHEVYTGVCVMKDGKKELACERTVVRFRPLTDGEIDEYVASGEPMDKAGAYGAQGRGSVLVEGIEGDFFNVMGLPACRLYLMIRDLFAQGEQQ
ncbi:MAG: septum formation protein Maf [Oscillospiraceae bacterium]|nr:septum formation protein Maf [Oscillospiraceae bacterium]